MKPRDGTSQLCRVAQFIFKAQFDAPWSAAAPKPQTEEWERLYAVFTHLSLIAAQIVPILPALIMWLIKREKSAFIDDHGREALNFQISLVVYFLAGLALMVVGIGFLILFAAWVLGIVGMIMGAVSAGKGRYFRYPVCLRLVRPTAD